MVSVIYMYMYIYMYIAVKFTAKMQPPVTIALVSHTNEVYFGDIFTETAILSLTFDVML